MTEDRFRTGAPRDVPPPRPVPGPAASALPDESGLARAARAVADAVAGLAGNSAGRAAAVREVVGAVAGAVGAAFGGGPDRAGAGAASRGERTPAAVLGDLLAAAAPRLPIRDAARIRQAYPGASDEEIADALVARAARLTSGIGAATGGLAAAHWLAPASLLAVPLELGAETVLIAAVEVVLIGELHELHGRPAPGDARDRANAYLAGWSAQRSIDGAGAPGVNSLLGTAAMRALRRRVTRRLAGSTSSAAPFLIGAALAGKGNRRATESLARKVIADLRAGRPPV
jgi:hypothetical protein